MDAAFTIDTTVSTKSGFFFFLNLDFGGGEMQLSSSTLGSHLDTTSLLCVHFMHFVKCLEHSCHVSFKLLWHDSCKTEVVVFFDVTPCSLLGRCACFTRTCCLSPSSVHFTLKMNTQVHQFVCL
jgi:hypothetical protein